MHRVFIVDITSSPQGDGNKSNSTLILFLVTVDITSSPQGDGNIHTSIVKSDRKKLTLHLPRKGMETTKVSPFLSIFYGVLTLHLPRKGMETQSLVVSVAVCKVELTLHLPRKGMETLDRVVDKA